MRKHGLLLCLLWIMWLPAAFSQGLRVEEIQEKRDIVDSLPDDKAQVVFIYESDNMTVATSNMSLDVVSKPRRNKDKMYEYCVTMVIKRGNNDYKSRRFSLTVPGIGTFSGNYSFKPYECRYFTVSNNYSRRIQVQEEDKPGYCRKSDYAEIEITADTGMIVELPPPIEAEHETRPVANEPGRERHVITIYTPTYNKLVKDSIAVWNALPTIKMYYTNSNMQEITLPLALQSKEKKHYSVLVVWKAGKEKKTVQPLTFFTVNGGYSPFPFWSVGFKVGQVKRVGWYVSAMSNFHFKGMAKSIQKGGSYDLTGRTKVSRLSLMAGLVVRAANPLAFYFGAGFGNVSQTVETKDGTWLSLPKNRYIGADVAVGMALYLGRFVLSAEAVTTNFETVEIIGGIGFSLPTRPKRIKIYEE